jgi:hypothetical protein
MSESQIIMSDFQSVSKKTGDEYEAIVEMDLIDRGLIIHHKNFYVEGTGCEVDFVAGSPNSRLEYVEAKGGQRGLKKRPGAKRTDNVKKAIANAALIKALDPSIYYVVYFSSTPKPNSYSDQMIKLALQKGILNEVRYKRDITYLIKQFWGNNEN